MCSVLIGIFLAFKSVSVTEIYFYNVNSNVVVVCLVIVLWFLSRMLRPLVTLTGARKLSHHDDVENDVKILKVIPLQVTLPINVQ